MASLVTGHGKDCVVIRRKRPLERISAKREILCRLETESTELRQLSQPDMTLRQISYLVRRREAAERRLAVALRTMAVVRKVISRDEEPKPTWSRGRRITP